MKKSQQVTLVLITSVLAQCHKPTPDNERRVYMRSDTTAPYSRAHYGYHGGPGLWFYAFRPYGLYRNGAYQRAGYYSSGLSQGANVGSNGFKGGIVRGGFGSHGFSVSS